MNSAGRSPSDDRLLVERFKLGEREVFRAIALKYRRTLAGVALSVLHNVTDADEIAQDALVKAYGGMDRFRGDCELGSWLYRIALNLARNRYWTNHRRRYHDSLSLQTILERGCLEDQLASDSADPSREVIRGEFCSMVSECMSKLDQKQREILTMRTVLDLSYEEIARALKIDLGTVKARLFRGRTKLRRLLLEKCPEYLENGSPAELIVINRRDLGTKR